MAVRLFCLLLFLYVCRPMAAEQKVVRVGWFQQPFYQEWAADGRPFGYNYEFLMHIAQHTGWTYEFVPVESIGSALDLLQNGGLDVVGTVTEQEESSANLAFPQFSSGNITAALFVAQGSKVAPDEIEAFDGMRVACVKSRIAQDLLAFAQENQFHVEMVYYANTQDVLTAVECGAVDAGVLGGFHSTQSMRVVANFAPQATYFALRASDPRTMEELNRALGDMMVENPFYDQDLFRKYLPEARYEIYLSHREKQFIEQAGPIRVGIHPDWFPIEMVDAETKVCSGVAVDLFNQIARMTGLEFEYVPIAPFLTESPDVQIVASVQREDNQTYEDTLRLTSSYMHVPLVRVRRANQDVQNARTVIASSRRYTDSTNQELIYVDSLEECLDEVLAGRADEAIINAYAAEQMLNRRKYTALQYTLFYSESYDLAAAVMPGNAPELCTILNKGLEAISESDLNTMILQNISRDTQMTWDQLVEQLPSNLIVLSVLLLLAVIALLGFLMRRQRRFARRIQTLLHHDELTGMLSFNGFLERARLQFHANPKADWWIIDFDINHFGEYNAINGFKAGDDLLRMIGRVTQEESGEQGLWARVQADHFVGLSQGTGQSEIKQHADHALLHLRKLSGLKAILISYGAYQVVDHEMSVADMCSCALTAKRNIKGNYECFVGFYDERLRYQQLAEVAILNKFDSALEADEFVHYFQPKYDCKTGCVVSAEALVRWFPNDGEPIMPGDFIELFEKNGMINRLDLHMFERLCILLASQIERNVPLVPISINISRAHLYDDEFVQKLTRIREKYKVPPLLIEVEITETAFNDYQHEMVHTIDQLHESGFLVSIDDFGSGFSSLNMLKHLPFDIMKLDRAFFDSLGTQDRGETIIINILHLAHDLKVCTVAEGVETAEQFNLLKSYGCDMVQGFYFARPMAVEQFELLLQKGEAWLSPMEQTK